MAALLSQLSTFTRTVVGRLASNGHQFNALLPKSIESCQSNVINNSWSLNPFRETHWKFAFSEAKRIKKYGFYARVKTRRGRKVIMRRILKGRYVLTH